MSHPALLSQGVDRDYMRAAAIGAGDQDQPRTCQHFESLDSSIRPSSRWGVGSMIETINYPKISSTVDRRTFHNHSDLGHRPPRRRTCDQVKRVTVSNRDRLRSRMSEKMAETKARPLVFGRAYDVLHLGRTVGRVEGELRLV